MNSVSTLYSIARPDRVSGPDSTPDPFTLDRFLQAQEDVMDAVRTELMRGRKTSHWMWFVFPQVAGLGHSATAKRFAIGSAKEARAYLAHPLLASRLRECSELVLTHAGRAPADIFGNLDALKLRSSMTLFAHYSDHPVYRRVLDTFYGGRLDEVTVAVIERWSESAASD
jgi:uncharacterized protein (DUF1810 family)